MKKVLVLVAIAISSFTVQAQSTSPRFGTAVSQDKTYRSMPCSYTVLADVASATCDTIYITPNAFTNFYKLTLTDSCVLAIRNVGGSFYGDEIIVDIQNTSGSGHKVYFTGTASYFSAASKWGMASTGISISPASTLTATVRAVFNGVLWNESSRAIR